MTSFNTAHSLEQFAAGTWLQQHCPPEAEAEAEPGIQRGGERKQDAVDALCDWTASLDRASSAAPLPPPHRLLLALAAELTPTTALITQRLLQPLLQLAAATSACVASPGDPSAHCEQRKQQLFWLCHLTVSVHKAVIGSAAAAAVPPAPRKKAAAAAAPQQQLASQWLQAVLPRLLQHMVDCYPRHAQTCSSTAQHRTLLAVLDSRDAAAADKALSSAGLSLVTAVSASSTSLPAAGRQAAAALLGAHLLFRHSQIQQGRAPTASFTDTVLQVLSSGDLHAELAAAAITGLLCSSATAQQGSQLLCLLAEAAGSAAQQQAPQLQQPPARSGRQRSLAGTRLEGSNPADIKLLHLLAAVLSVASSGDGGNASTAPLLAAAMLPKLLLLAGLSSGSPAGRKSILLLAGVAASAALPTPSHGNTDCSSAAACGAAHAAGITVLAAAAQSDKDANVRAKALALLQGLVPIVWQHVCFWRRQQDDAAAPPAQECQQQQPQQPNDPDAASHPQQRSETADAEASAPTASTDDSNSHALDGRVAAGVSGSFAALVHALQSQLAGSSKASRLKALQLLQRLLQPPAAAAALSRQHSSRAHGPADALLMLQQQAGMVMQVFPAISLLLEAPEEDALHCPAGKVAAGELLTVMAQVLEPGQALQLALSSTGHSPAAASALLTSLSSQCSGQALYDVLLQHFQAGAPEQQQQLCSHQQSDELSRLKRLLAGRSSAVASSSGGATAEAAAVVAGSEALRQHAFLSVCQRLNAAVSATTADVKPPGDLQCEPGDQQQQQLDQRGGLQLAQQQLLLAVQLLEACGGCCNTGRSSSSSSGTCSERDLGGELAILVDALDVCWHWMKAAPGSSCSSSCCTGLLAAAQQAATPPGAAAPEELAAALCFGPNSTCHQLLCSLLRVLRAAARAAVGGPPGAWRQWAAVGGSLMHHLETAVALTREAVLAGGVVAPSRLPLTTLDLFIEVLVLANSRQQLLLHELLLSWHQQLQAAAAPSAGQPAEPAQPAAAGGKTAAFLLLLQHLSCLYELELPGFQQQLLATLRGGGAPSTATDAAAAAAAAALTHHLQPSASRVPGDQQQQEQQAFDYLQEEEEKACIASALHQYITGMMADTAPACYVPVLVQLLQQGQGVPLHLQVLALRALQPLLLLSPDVADQHQPLLASLLAAGASAVPAALQLQAVATAAAMISARPAQSGRLVRQLEQLLLASRQTGERQARAPSAAAQDGSVAGGGGAVCAADVAASAAGVFCQLVLRQKLLLAGSSWAVIAAGLLAGGDMQAVSRIMQHMLLCLLRQQLQPAISAALGLLTNLDRSSSSSSSSARHPSADAAAAVRLVQQHLLQLLSAKDLASPELMLPLLQALGEAAAGGDWGAAAGPAALLACCVPTGRCLDSLLAMLQNHKHNLALQGSPDVFRQLPSFVRNFKPATASSASAGRGSGSRRGRRGGRQMKGGRGRQQQRDSDDGEEQPQESAAADGAGLADGDDEQQQSSPGALGGSCTQAKLLQMLASLAGGARAAAGGRGHTAAAAAAAASTDEDEADAETDGDGADEPAAAPAAARGSRRAGLLKRRALSGGSSAAAAAGRSATKKGPAAAGTDGDSGVQELQQLVAERQRQLALYRGLKQHQQGR